MKHVPLVIVGAYVSAGNERADTGILVIFTGQSEGIERCNSIQPFEICAGVWECGFDKVCSVRPVARYRLVDIKSLLGIHLDYHILGESVSVGAFHKRFQSTEHSAVFHTMAVNTGVQIGIIIV